MTEKQKELVAAVRKYAEDHYDAGGWDVMVECLYDDDIAEWIGNARTLKGAIKRCEPFISIMAEREADARHYAENW